MVKKTNIDLVKIIKKKFRYLKNKKISKKNELLKDNILDSLELMNILLDLEKMSNFNLKNYLKKNKSFKIDNIERNC